MCIRFEIEPVHISRLNKMPDETVMAITKLNEILRPYIYSYMYLF